MTTVLSRTPSPSRVVSSPRSVVNGSGSIVRSGASSVYPPLNGNVISAPLASPSEQVSVVTSPERVGSFSPRSTFTPSARTVASRTTSPVVTSRTASPVVDVSPPLRPVSPRTMSNIASSPSTRIERTITPPASTRYSEAITPGPLAKIPGFVSSPRREPSPRRSVGRTLTARTIGTTREETDTQTIEAQLTKLGYIVESKVFVQVNGEFFPKYLKATNQFGQTVFIDLDVKGNVVYGAGDRTMIVSQEAAMIPESTIIGTYQCAQTAGCDVAFDCQNGVCVLKRTADDPSQPTMVTLQEVSQTPQEGKVVAVEGAPAYPVISLSSLLNGDPLVAADIIDKTQTGINKTTYDQCEREWANLQMALQNFNNSLQRFRAYEQQEFKDLFSQLDELRRYRAEYVRRSQRGTLSPADETKFVSVGKNINDRQDQMNQLTGLMDEVPLITEELNKLTERLRQTTSVIESKLSTIQQTIA